MSSVRSESNQPARAGVGDEAPDFTLRAASGAEVTLSALRGRKRALLLFYPEDMTKG